MNLVNIVDFLNNCRMVRIGESAFNEIAQWILGEPRTAKNRNCKHVFENCGYKHLNNYTENYAHEVCVLCGTRQEVKL